MYRNYDVFDGNDKNKRINAYTCIPRSTQTHFYEHKNMNLRENLKYKKKDFSVQEMPYKWKTRQLQYMQGDIGII